MDTTPPMSQSEFSQPNKSIPPTPRAFDMTEPFQQNGIWCFWLTADVTILEFARHLSCVLGVAYMAPLFGRPQGRTMVSIDPRYDHQEAWVWIYEQIEFESRQVELAPLWEDALTSAAETDNFEENDSHF